MEFINRSVVKWVFIAVVAITFAIQISDAFSQERIKQGYPANAASRVQTPPPLITLLPEVQTETPTERIFKNAIPDNYKTHPEYGKVKLKSSLSAIELIQHRTANSRTFLNPDGTYSITQSSGILHYKDNHDQWRSISNQPSVNSRVTGEFGIVDSDCPVLINTITGASSMVLENSKAIEFSENALMQIADAAGNLISTIKKGKSITSNTSGNEVTFKNFWNQVDRVHRISSDRIKTNYVIKNLPSGLPSDGYIIFSEKINVPDGWEIKESGAGENKDDQWFGMLEVYNEQGNKIGAFENLAFYDNGFDSEIQGGYKIEKTNTGYCISTMVPASWLASSERVFPVTIDPTLTNSYASGNIGSTHNAFCTVDMNVILPPLSTVSNSYIESTYVASGSTKKRNARIQYTGPGATIGDYYCNDNSNGTCAQSTNSTTIANGFYASGIVPFSIGVKRTNNSGTACSSANLYVSNTTWEITLTYTTCATPTSGGIVSGATTSTCGQLQSYSCAEGSGNYQWQYSSNGGSTYTSITGATSATISFSYNIAGTYKLRVVRSQSSCADSYSNIINTVVSAPTTGTSTSNPFIVNNLPYNGTHATFCLPSSFTGTGNQSTPALFLKFTTGSCASNISITTCDATTNFDTYIFLLNSSGTVLTSNDDFNGCQYSIGNNQYLSRISNFIVTPNTIYYAVVQAYRFASPNSGNFGIQITEGIGGSVTPAVTITGGSAICPNGSINLQANAVNGGLNPTYVWKVNNQNTATTTSSFNSSALINGDQVTVTMTSTNACANPATVSSSAYTVVVGLPPIISLNSNSPLCDGNDLILNANVDDPAAGFVWSGPNNFTSTIQNPILNSGSTAIEGTYSVVVTGINGCSSAASLEVDYSSFISASVANFQHPSCAGLANGTIQIEVTGGTLPYSYYWSNGQNTIQITNLEAGPYAITVFDANGCTAYTEQELENAAPLSTAQAGPDRQVCNVLSLQLEANQPSYGNGTWSKVSGAGIIADASSPTTTVSNLGTTGSNVFRWTLSNGCESSTDDVAIKVFTAPPANLPAISGPALACKGDTITFSTSLSSPTILWELRQAGQIINGQGTQNIQVVFESTSNSAYNACVTGTNACGSNVVACTAIRTNTSIPTLVVAPVDVCDGSTEIYRIKKIAGDINYKWLAPAGVTLNGNSSPYYTTDTAVSIYFPVGFVSAKIGVASTAGCDYSRIREVLVSAAPLIPFPIHGLTGNICNTEQTYSIRTRVNQRYEWNVPSGATITYTAAGTDSIKVQFGNNVNGKITVKAINLCGIYGPERKLTVTSNPATPGVITGPLEACPNTGGYYYSIVPVTNATSYQWTLPEGASITSGNGSNNIEVIFGATVNRIGVQAIASCGLSALRNLAIASNCRTIQNSTTTSPAIDDENLQRLNLQAYPDAASNTITIIFNASKDGVYKFKLIDPSNREVNSGEINVVKGSNKEQIDMSALPNAVYRLVLENENKSQELNISFF